MSSTTSSDCESCGCSQCMYSFENNYNDYGKLMTNGRHVPIFATMAHPLIYYAEVPQSSNRRSNDQPRKDNPFKKAFKWYTQERGRTSNKNDLCPERSGFANWLDSKYDEYLYESGQPAKPAGASRPPMTREPRTQRAAIEEPCPGVSKTYGRLKSPWRKRRRSVNDGGDVPEKGPCGSCEYILKPKELTRAISEHTPTSGGKSNATLTSSNMPCGKCSGRSRSLSDVGRERSVPRYGDTFTHIAQAPRSQEQELGLKMTPNRMYHREPSKVHCKCPQCMCPSDEVPELVKESSKKRHHPCCPCPSKIQSLTIPPMPLQEKLSEVVKEPSIKQEPTRLSYCQCPQEKIPQVEQLPSEIQNVTYPPMPLQEKQPEIVKEPSIKQEPTTLPCCQCPQEKIPQVEQLPSKIQNVTYPLMPLQEKQPEIVKEPSIKQEPTTLPCCQCPQEKIPQVEQLPSKIQNVTYPPMPLQEKQPEIVKEPSIKQEPTTLPCCQCPQEKIPRVEQLPSKIQNVTYPIPQQEIVPQVVKVPSKVQNPSAQPGPCCKCNLKKVPQIVQVPSQSRAVQESCQVPEDKVLPVNEETQYDPSLKPPRSAPSLHPCCCNTCNPPYPPPPIICFPVKVQNSKILSPETCLTAPSSICDPPKRQKKMTQKRSLSCQFDEGNKSKCDTQCQHQNEPCSCSKPCCSKCHAVDQACDPVSIRRQSHSATNEDIGECSAVKEVSVPSKLTRSVTCASNDAAQTSDHSICFDKDGVCSCQCPLFLKIIYADI